MQTDFSIVIPVFNEDESLRELVANIKGAFLNNKKSYEIIFIDDGSTDRSFEILRQFEYANKNIKVYSFRKNLGKSPALMLGFQKATGRFIVTLDADLQDDPTNIMSLYQRLTKSKLDLVTGWRKQRKDSSFKVVTSKIFNKTVSIMFGVKLHDLNSGLKLYRSETAKELRIYGGMHRFIPIIAADIGFSVGEKDILHHARKYGVSKYKFTKVFTDIPDLITIYFITKYNRRPLHFFGKIGGLLFSAGLVALLYLFYLRLAGERIGDRPLLLFGILLVLVGLQIALTGLVADLIVNKNDSDKDYYPMKYESEN